MFLPYSETIYTLLRVAFAVITFLVMATQLPLPSLLGKILAGALASSTLTAALLGAEYLFKRCDLRTFNTVTVGLIIGYAFAAALSLFLPDHFILRLAGLYLGLVLAFRFSYQFHVMIPFVQFSVQKPLPTPKIETPPGEIITLKIQRYGKEPRQGVGYLEDGTMVVVNNGGDWIGEIIDTQVISVKQTSAGRIIFTNALYEGANV